VDGRGAVVRRDADDRGTLVAGLVDEVCVRDLGVGRIPAPDEDEVRVQEVVRRAREGDLAQRRHGTRVMIPDLAVHVEHGRVEDEARAMDADSIAAVGVGGAGIPDDRVRPALDEGVETSVRDLPQALLPTDAAKASLAPRADPTQGVEQTRAVDHAFAVAGALLTAARVVVGNLRIRRLVAADLLFAEDYPVLHVDVPVAAPLVPAVDEVGALVDRVESQPFAIEIAPAGVARHGEVWSGLPVVRTPAGGRNQGHEPEREREASGSAQEVSSRESGHGCPRASIRTPRPSASRAWTWRGSLPRCT